MQYILWSAVVIVSIVLKFTKDKFSWCKNDTIMTIWAQCAVLCLHTESAEAIQVHLSVEDLED